MTSTKPPPRLRTAVAVALTRLADQVDAIESDHAADEVSLKSLADSMARIANACIRADATATRTELRLHEFANNVGGSVRRIEEAMFNHEGRLGALEGPKKAPNGHADAE